MFVPVSNVHLTLHGSGMEIGIVLIILNYCIFMSLLLCTVMEILPNHYLNEITHSFDGILDASDCKFTVETDELSARKRVSRCMSSLVSDLR
jgi:hypothetical protein